MPTHLWEGYSDLPAPTPGRSSQSDRGQPVPADKPKHGEKPERVKLNTSVNMIPVL